MDHDIAVFLSAMRTIEVPQVSQVEAGTIAFIRFLEAKTRVIRATMAEGTPAVVQATTELFAAIDDVLEVYLAERDAVRS